MTDFDKRAREILNRMCSESCGAPPCPCANDIAAALKAAYNEGLEDAAKHAEDAEYYRADQHSIAADVRTMKIPT